MSKKGRANRASGAPKSSPSVRALSSVAGKGPASSKKARVAEPSEPPPSSKSGPESDALSENKASSGEVSEATTEKGAVESATEAKTEELAAKATETAEGKATDDSGSDAEAGSPNTGKGQSAAPKAPAKELDDEAFFSEGTRRSSMPPPIEGDAEDDRTVRLREDPEVLARRARSVKVVGYVVGGFALLLGVGVLAKVFETPHAKPPAPVFVHGATSADEAPLPSGNAVPSPTASTASSVPTASVDASVDASVASLDAGSSSSDAASSAVDAGAAIAMPIDASTMSREAGAADLVEAGLDAKALKRACQRALDTGKLGEAIQNGEASVAADPTDGEAWLLLGAAYDQKGRAAEARTAYQSCVQKGKRGPVGECAALLR